MASDKQRSVDEINPTHYKKGNIETIDYLVAVCKDLSGDEAICVANAIKYLSRYRQKSSSPQKDVEKAKWYVDKLIEILMSKESSKTKTIDNDYPRSDLNFERGIDQQ